MNLALFRKSPRSRQHDASDTEDYSDCIRRMPKSFPRTSDYHRLLGLWVLRAISPQLGRNRYLRGRLGHDEIDEFLGLPDDALELPGQLISPHLDQMLSRLEKCRRRPCFNSTQRQNFDGLAKLLNLNKAEQAILEYLTCAQVESVLKELHQCIGQLYFTDTALFLSKVLSIQFAAARRALGPKSRLRTCGIIGECEGESGKFEFFSPGLAKALIRRNCNPQRIIRQFGVIPPHPDLSLRDFSRQQPELDILLPHLRQALSRHKAGVNILLYGPPGTGKTQLARVIGKATKSKVFEIATESEQGEQISGKGRLQALRASQAIFGGTRSLLVFDEAEDVLVPRSPFQPAVLDEQKGWFNQLLESNRQPVIWISNSVQEMDPAFVRRFDVVIEVPILSKSQRLQVIKKHVGEFVGSESSFAKLADSEHLSPAIIARSCDVIQGISHSLDDNQRAAAVYLMVSNTLKAQGYPDPEKATTPIIDPNTYDVANLNTEADLGQIAKSLKAHPSARICLYGPPGTGKTAFAHWLANELDRPVACHRASDLLSPYVGETEQKIARAFDNAIRDGAVLIIDEVDSFLQDRSKATRSWEVTQVNEMLTRIESYPGILVASTNLVGHLDPASMRRFDLKLNFDYLRPEQSERLLVSYCHIFNLMEPTQSDRSSIAQIEKLTPGDFASAARRQRFDPIKNATSFIARIVDETQHRLINHRKIGFLR